jgi:hypothetical protein
MRRTCKPSAPLREEINARAFVEMIAAIAANNRAGGWRKLSTP